MSVPCVTRQRLSAAIDTISLLADELGDTPPGDGNRFDMRRIDWFDLRNMLLVSRVVAEAALARTETRGAHQREDYPRLSPDWAFNQTVGLQDARIELSAGPRDIAEASVVSENATLRIWRGLDVNDGRWETYEVPL